MEPLTESLLELKKRHLMPCVYHFYQEPMVLREGHGCWLTDSQGKRYLDVYAGVGVVNCGHGHPAIVAAAREQLERLQHTTTIYLTEPMLYLAAELAQFIGGHLSRCFFCVSGSEANEGAMLLARLATGRPGFLALSQSLHGRTHLTGSVTGMAFWRSDPHPASEVYFAQSPTCGTCPLGQHPATCQAACATEVEEILAQHGSSMAAMITESIHGNGGIHPLPDQYLRRIRQATRQAGVLLILDEAQTGFCRTGQRFGYQQAGIEPDVVTVCKALANGLPMAAYITTDDLARCFTRPSASTFGGNLVASQAARATLAVMTAQRLEQQAAITGQHLSALLQRLAQRHAGIREVRGRGLMWGLELCQPDGSPASSLLPVLLEKLKNRGVLAGMTGMHRQVLTLMPPLVITHEDLAFLDQALTGAMAEIW